MDTSRFFAFARERHRIYLNRQQGLPRPWTTDQILARYRFTNVFRELDATTVWFRENVREPMRDRPEVLLATVLFRWFNRISVGEAIFNQSIFDESVTSVIMPAWDVVENMGTAGLASVKSSVLSYCGSGPYVTGAYIIKTPDGMDKLTGVLWCVEQFMKEGHRLEVNSSSAGVVDWRTLATCAIESRGAYSLEDVWNWLRQFPFLGDFMAYEIVTDLRHTALLDLAPDIMTWANPGPGASRGLNRISERDLNKRLPSHALVCEMRTILERSRDPSNWPSVFPMLEMREVEHTLCEFDKYERVRLGQGRPRGIYR